MLRDFSSILTHSLNTLLPLRDEAGQEVLHNIVVRPLASGRATHCLLQINDVTVTLIGSMVPSGALVTFVAGDYDGVSVETRAP